jgi:3-phosphoshikimate 1-carboxyvinyltransferase
MVDELTVHRSTKPLREAPNIPGDKSISHRALMLSALADGQSQVSGLSSGDDVMRTLVALERLGAETKWQGDTLSVKGFGSSPSSAGSFNCGNSGTAMRLLMGMCAGFAGEYEFTGDESLSKRPMDRVAEPLELMGAKVVTEFPVQVSGGNLHGIDYELPVASAQVKSAIMFAALNADQPTTVRETLPTRAHTEEMFHAAGINVSVENQAIRINPGRPNARQWTVAVDPSQAAFWVVAALLVPDSKLRIENIYVGKERIGFIDVLQRMGAHVSVEELDSQLHTGVIEAQTSELIATDIDAHELPRVIDEIPILATAAARADGESVFKELSELRIKESDRIQSTTALVGALGAEVQVEGDNLNIVGAKEFNGGFSADSHGDHRIAMSAAVAALIANQPITISPWSCVETSYPKFAEELAKWQK